MKAPPNPANTIAFSLTNMSTSFPLLHASRRTFRFWNRFNQIFLHLYIVNKIAEQTLLAYARS